MSFLTSAVFSLNYQAVPDFSAYVNLQCFRRLIPGGLGCRADRVY